MAVSSAAYILENFHNLIFLSIFNVGIVKAAATLSSIFDPSVYMFIVVLYLAIVCNAACLRKSGLSKVLLICFARSISILTSLLFQGGEDGNDGPIIELSNFFINSSVRPYIEKSCVLDF